MEPLSHLILSEFGVIIKTIGTTIIQNYSMTIHSIHRKVNININTIKVGIAVLIQHKIVDYVEKDNEIRYYINTDALYRRMYFPLYIHYISTEHPDVREIFHDILLNGIYSMLTISPSLQKLIDLKIVKKFHNEYMDRSTYYSINLVDTPEKYTNKKIKLTDNYYEVNFDILDRLLIINEFKQHLTINYNTSLALVYQVLAENTIYSQLSNKHALMSRINERLTLHVWKNKSSVDTKVIQEYLEYLKGMDIINNELKILSSGIEVSKLQKISMYYFLENIAQQRLFFLIFKKKLVGDKDLTINSLLPIIYQKSAIFDLQKKGFIYERCVGSYKATQRPEYCYFVSMEYTRSNIKKIIENELAQLQCNSDTVIQAKLIKLHFIYSQK